MGYHALPRWDPGTAVRAGLGKRSRAKELVAEHVESATEGGKHGSSGGLLKPSTTAAKAFECMLVRAALAHHAIPTLSSRPRLPFAALFFAEAANQ